MLERKPVPLFAISPNHGKVRYQWDRKNFLAPDWVPLNVPTSTCLLFVDSVGKYRCSFDSETIEFQVRYNLSKKNSSDGKTSAYSSSAVP